jgi:hypothetical protein
MLIASDDLRHNSCPTDAAGPERTGQNILTPGMGKSVRQDALYLDTRGERG